MGVILMGSGVGEGGEEVFEGGVDGGGLFEGGEMAGVGDLDEKAERGDFVVHRLGDGGRE